MANYTNFTRLIVFCGPSNIWENYLSKYQFYFNIFNYTSIIFQLENTTVRTMTTEPTEFELVHYMATKKTEMSNPICQTQCTRPEIVCVSLRFGPIITYSRQFEYVNVSIIICLRITQCQLIARCWRITTSFFVAKSAKWNISIYMNLDFRIELNRRILLIYLLVSDSSDLLPWNCCQQLNWKSICFLFLKFPCFSHRLVNSEYIAFTLLNWAQWKFLSMYFTLLRIRWHALNSVASVQINYYKVCSTNDIHFSTLKSCDVLYLAGGKMRRMIHASIFPFIFRTAFKDFET